MSPLERRAKATQATFDRFEGKPFAWGEHDCVLLVDFQLKGVKTKTPIGKFGSWANEAGALRAMKRNGYQSLEGILSDFLLPIAPAMALPGDILGLQADRGQWTSLNIYLGNGRVLGFVESEGPICRVFTIKWAAAIELRPVSAWRSC